jgi:hypothetical protein
VNEELEGMIREKKEYTMSVERWQKVEASQIFVSKQHKRLLKEVIK